RRRRPCTSRRRRPRLCRRAAVACCATDHAGDDAPRQLTCLPGLRHPARDCPVGVPVIGAFGGNRSLRATCTAAPTAPSREESDGWNPTPQLIRRVVAGVVGGTVTRTEPARARARRRSRRR